MISKICRVSGKQFEITTEDLEFYAKMEIISREDLAKLKSREILDCVGLPTLCPEERNRRRLSWINHRKLYSRFCDGSGQTIISNYSSDKEFPVYKIDYWFSDKWDQFATGRDFDFSRDFFSQFNELQEVAPRPALLTLPQYDENSEYTNHAGHNKNCYLIFDSDYNRDSMYSYDINNCTDVLDCFRADKSELSYELIDSVNCFGSYFLQNCKGCNDSWFLGNCIGCNNCFGCVNLRNKQYYFLNKKLNKEEYKKKLSELHLDNFENLQRMRQQFQKFYQKFPRKFMEGFQNENVLGNYLVNCKNAQNCFDCRHLQDGKYCVMGFDRVKDAMDCMENGLSELIYENSCTGDNEYNNKFCSICFDNAGNLDYCLWTWQSQNCFGCVGLRNAQYCILNKQYSKAEYFKTREKIIEHMKNTGEWGEFFPIELSPFCYNETVAQEYFPLNPPKSELKDQKFFQSPDLGFKYKWKDKISRDFKPATIENIPDDIKEVEDSICREILACENDLTPRPLLEGEGAKRTCGKNYQIQKAELRFYRKMNLPIPRKCPDCRHAERMTLRNPRTLFLRECAECKTGIQTTFSPDRPEKVLCENCYLNIVN